MKEAGDEEEDCEGSGGAFGGGVEPEGVWDCGNLLGVCDLQGENQDVLMRPIFGI